MPVFVGFFSGVLLIGAALVLPVCIVGAVVQAIAATRQQNTLIR